MSVPDVMPVDLALVQPLEPEELAAFMAWADQTAADAGVEPLELVQHVAEVAMAPDFDPGPVGDDMPAPARAGARWRIRSAEEAEWAMRHLAAADANLELLKSQRDAYVAKITAWHLAAMREPNRSAAFFRAHLEAWGVEQRELHPKVATIPLPSGAIATTTHKPAVQVLDDEAVAEWAEATLPAMRADELVKLTTKVYIGELRKEVAITDMPTGRHWVSLSCGCSMSTDEVEDCAALVGLELDCDANPEHGTQVVQSCEPELEPAAIDADGGRVPGTIVEPQHVTAKAKPSL